MTYPIDLKYMLPAPGTSLKDADIPAQRMFAPGSKLRVRVSNIVNGSNIFVDLIDYAPKDGIPTSIRQQLRIKEPLQWDVPMPDGGINITLLKAGTHFPRAKICLLQDYGAFVDCGVYRRGRRGKLMRSDGLLHKSEMLNKHVLANDNVGLMRYGLHGASPELAEEAGVRILNVGDEIDVRVKECMKNSG